MLYNYGVLIVYLIIILILVLVPNKINIFLENYEEYMSYMLIYFYLFNFKWTLDVSDYDVDEDINDFYDYKDLEKDE
jgi:Gpi18-like mannosyltransferase